MDDLIEYIIALFKDLDPSSLMIIGGGIGIVFALLAILNMIFFSKSEEGLTSFKMFVHLISSFLSMLGFLALAAGFIWFLVVTYVG